jgi:NADH-quinone oxidoreductase subunit L
MRNMGGLRKYMPITWITSLLGSLALIGTPFFSGFYSKDSIIEAVHAASEAGMAGAGFAYFAVIAGVFVTAFYSFRMYFLVFHGPERFGKEHGHSHSDDHAHAHDAHKQAEAAHGVDAHALHDSDAHHEEEDDDHGHHGLAPGQKPHESPLVVTLPLILLAIPSVIIGFLSIDKLLYGDFFRNVIYINDKHPAMEELHKEFGGAASMGLHAFVSLPFILALAGVVAAYYCYMINPRVPAWFYNKLRPIHTLLDNKYYMDKFNEVVFAGGARALGKGLWQIGDRGLIEGIVNGSAKLVGWFSTVVRTFQTGYIYHYAFVMILGVLGTLLYFFPFWRA